MQVVYAHEEAPAGLTSSIFLAGPTPRDAATPSWRPEALRLLRERGYGGVVFVPEPRGGAWGSDYDGQLRWEEEHLHMADVILFWLPRQLGSMPGLTTNDEWGTHKFSGKCVFGAPDEAEKVRYQRVYAEKLRVPMATTLEGTVELALGQVGAGAARVGGERQVPLHVWQTEAFRGWYGALKGAGNRLDGARLEWVCRGGPGRRWLFLWALRVDVFIASEGRSKRNEVVLGRPDVAAVLMTARGATWQATRVVMVREFRSAVRNRGGSVLELPSGSSFEGGAEPLRLACDEAREETGLAIEQGRLRPVASRQLASTLLSHQAHLFAVELTGEELSWLAARRGQAQGEEGSSERTFVEIYTVAELLTHPDVDWSTLGMIVGALAAE